MKYVTLDDYYPNSFYNEAKESLKNNGIIPKEFISIKTPYYWYFQLNQLPIMVNYDEVSSSNERWLVNKVQATKPNDEYLLQRRDQDVGSNAMLKFVENKPLREARLSDYAVFFNVKNKEQIEKITKDIPVRIYYFGKYYNNKFKLALCTNKMILNYLDEGQILLEDNGEYKEPGRFEAELNFKIFRGKDMLQKYVDTTYFEKGKYYPVKIKSDRNDAVSMTL